jgi:hypothetical protein
MFKGELSQRTAIELKSAHEISSDDSPGGGESLGHGCGNSGILGYRIPVVDYTGM